MVQGQRDGEGGALPLPAVQLHGAVVISHGVLDDGQTQSRAAGGLGVALVHPVEPLKHAALVLRRDADAGIRHGDTGIVALAGHMDGDAAAVHVVLDGIVAQVGKHLAE